MTVTRIGPGVYVEDRTLHFDLGELCDAFGLERTPENEERAAHAARLAVADTFGPGLVPSVELDDAEAWRRERTL